MSHEFAKGFAAGLPVGALVLTTVEYFRKYNLLDVIIDLAKKYVVNPVRNLFAKL